jgi:hypothetical protein
MEQKKEAIKNVKITYADNVVPDKDRERIMTRQVNVWLEPLIKEINEQNAKVEIFLNESGINHLSFFEINNELHAKALERLKIFQNPSGR